LANTEEEKRKEGKYTKWQNNQGVDVWSPISTMSMLQMAKL